MKNYLKIFLSGFLSGLLISIGCLTYLSLKDISLVLASLFFAFGLFTIINLKLHLFTGKVGYVLANKKSFLLELLVMLLANSIGAITCASLFSVLKDSRFDYLIASAINVSTVKLNSSWVSILILSFFCGIMIFLAVDVSLNNYHVLIKVITTFLAVSIFIICGFEHCIANMFYFSLAHAWSSKTLFYIFLMIIGNSLGSITIYLILNYLKK